VDRNPKVFCSHRSVDKPRVKEIAARLAAAGIDPWVDQWEIAPGDDIVARINEGLVGYDVGLLFLSKTSLESGWVSAEASTLIYQMIEDGKRVIPVMIDADAPVPPLLKSRARLGLERIEELIDAIYGEPSGKPKVAPPRTRTRQRTLQIALRSTGPEEIAVLANLDGQPVTPEQETRLGADFVFSYQDFLRARFPTAHRSPLEAAAKMREAELDRLGDAVGCVVFPGPVASALVALLDEARAANETVLLAFETADPALLSIPFEAARLPGGRIPALDPGVRLLRRHLGARAGAAASLPGPLRILVAVGAPDEGKTKNTVLDIEAELQTILDAVDTARNYGNAEVTILEVGHPDQIRAALLNGTYHVLHLSGHGTAGKMELETEDGEPLEVSAQDLANVIRAAQEPLPLVVLATCHGGVSASDTASFAQGLLENGIPMVLAMQSTVSDWYATRLAGAFYGHLTQRDVQYPSHALALARQDVEKERREALSRGEAGAFSLPEYATPSLFCAGDEIPLLDWDADKLESPRRPPQPVSGPVPLLKIGDLIGRRQELRDLLRILLDDRRAMEKHGKKVGAILQGIGGVGKSALAGRAMSRLADRGWRLAPVEGRWTLGELATRLGASLITDEDGSIRQIAGMLVEPTQQDQVRIQLLGQLLAAFPVLLVLDNFEDNLTLAGTSFLDSSTGPVLEALFRSCNRGKILVTSRYPVPRSESWLVPLPLGPLSPAQTRKLLYRLTELKGRPPEVLSKILRMIGGHPRVLEYLDAILHSGTGRLSIVEEKLRENVNRMGLSVSDLGRNLDQSLQDAIRVGAQDIFLDEFLATVVENSEDREVLGQASVFPVPIDLDGLAFALSDVQEPSAERVEKVRKAAALLVRTSLLIPLEDDSVWVHRWTAEALKKRIGPNYAEYCRRAGEFFIWRSRTVSRSLIDAMEGVRQLLRAGAYDRAVVEGQQIHRFMDAYGQSTAIVAFMGEILEALPESHAEYALYLGREADAICTLGDTDKAVAKIKKASEILEQIGDLRNLAASYQRMGDLLRALGQGEQAKDFYEKFLRTIERLAKEEPNHADYQRGLAVSYEKMGDILRALGQSEQFKFYYERSLHIRERLADDEPNRADYQRDLAVSYERMGDILSALGQSEQAKFFYEKSLRIRKRLADNEPSRADYQTDLAVSYQIMGDGLSALSQGEQAKVFYEKSLRIRERLVEGEPNRADYQEELIAIYQRMGDLLRVLGQGEQVKFFYEKSLRISERLADDKPNRSDYQRGLALSYGRIGDILSNSGQDEEAKNFYEKALFIFERLAAAEPNRADYQPDLVVSLVRLAPFAPEEGRSMLLRALAILEGLKDRGALLPMYEPWIAGVQEMLGK
jgi:tetratricopeptide (TPR) repeat protein